MDLFRWNQKGMFLGKYIRKYEMNCAISGELYTVDSYRNFSQEKKNIRQHFSFENNLMAMLLSSPFFVFVIRSSSTCATYHCSTNPPWWDHWQGSVRRGVVWPLERRKCCCENIFFSWRALMVPGSWDLPDSHAEAWKHFGIYCCWQQRWVQNLWFNFYADAHNSNGFSQVLWTSSLEINLVKKFLQSCWC